MKAYLTKLTTLSPLSLKADLLLYVVASKTTISAVLAQETDMENQKKQSPIYFVSKSLGVSKWNYTEIEKIIYAVGMASRKLKHYFQAHHIVVPSSFPLKDVLGNKEIGGRIAKWAMELNEYVIDFVHRSSIQSQALADFIADWIPEPEVHNTFEEAKVWTTFYDGAWGLREQGLR